MSLKAFCFSSSLNFTGGEQSIESPYIDHFAASGLILNRHYSAWLCTPTRASIMTGRYPISLGIQHDVFHPWTAECLDTSQHLLPEIVQSNGYATHIVGKWHLGYARWDCLPCRRGFDSFLGLTQGSMGYVSHVHSGYPDLMECSDSVEGGLQFKTLGELGGLYSMDIFEERAKEVVENHSQDKPLFLYLAVQAPHSPFYAPLRYIDGDCVGDRCVMQGMVRAIEGLMLGVINKMKSKGMWEETIMIFHSDNGAPDTAFNSNFPPRGYKQYLWEGGLRNPAFIYSASEELMPNRGASNSLIHVSDWFDTIISISGGWDNWDAEGKVRPDDLDSIDQSRHLLYGEEGLRTNIMLHIDPVTHVAAYIKEDYKLLIGNQSYAADCDSTKSYNISIESLDMNFISLYNIVDDPRENTDLWNDRKEIGNKMIDDLTSYLSHQRKMQCLLRVDSEAFPNSDVPWYLPWMVQ